MSKFYKEMYDLSDAVGSVRRVIHFCKKEYNISGSDLHIF